MTQPTLSRWFTVEEVGDVTIVRFARASILADEAVDEVRRHLFDLAGQGRRLFVLSFAQVTGLASRALGVLVGLHNKLSATGGRLVLCDVTPFLSQFFETAKLPNLLCFQGGVDEAVQTLTVSP
jgi:anti-sigma B factor antagonist